MSKAPPVSKNNPSDILLALLVEVGGLAIVTAVAGISDGMANIMLITIIGIAMLWAFTHTAEMNALVNVLGNIEKAG